jgi:hypothetical protein
VAEEGTLSPKEKFDAFMRLADFRMEVRKERRQLEWRLSLGLWIALAAGMIAFKNAELHIWTPLLVFILIVVVVGHAVLWVHGNWWRNERDAKQAYQMIRMAEAVVDVHYQPTRRAWDKHVENLEKRWAPCPIGARPTPVVRSTSSTRSVGTLSQSL